MHKQLLQEVVASVRRRIAQGDCPTEPPFTREQLEDAVDSLASERDDALGQAKAHLNLIDTLTR